MGPDPELVAALAADVFIIPGILLIKDRATLLTGDYVLFGLHIPYCKIIFGTAKSLPHGVSPIYMDLIRSSDQFILYPTFRLQT